MLARARARFAILLALVSCLAAVPRTEALASAGLVQGTSSLGTRPSGQGIPAAPQGYSLRYADDFSSKLDPTVWGSYVGTLGGGGGPVCKQNAFTYGGTLVLRESRVNGTWCGAGVSGRNTTLTFGIYLVRARFTRGYGVKACALLWPAVGWPPEVDFQESPASDANRTYNTMTNHYNADNEMQHANTYGDFSQWHTVGLIWTPTALTYTVDGKVTATMTGYVPAQSMTLDLQIEQGIPPYTPTSATPSAVLYYVDWVAVFSPVAGS